MPQRNPLAVACLTLLLFAVSLFAGPVQAHDVAERLSSIIGGSHRSQENRARDQYRHPKETLLFFGLRPDMSVVEISPAAGWYTEIIAPLLRQQGKYYAAVPTVTNDMPEAMKRRDASYRQMLAATPDLYGQPAIVSYDPSAPVFAPDGSADLVLTFRNVHNWAKAGHAQSMFNGFYRALKPGGVLGVVEHRAKPDTPLAKQIESGYMTEQYVIEAATAAGFRLDGMASVELQPSPTQDS